MMSEQYDVHIHTHRNKCYEFVVTAEDRHDASDKAREGIKDVKYIWVFARRENGKQAPA